MRSALPPSISRRGRIYLLLASIIVVLAASTNAGAATTHSCGGFAPTQTRCTTGTHVYATVLSHDVAADINYIGTIESALVWSGGSRVFRCTYTQALRRSCVGLGLFPPLNAAFTHRCRSLVAGSAITLPGLPGDGIEGGSGTWACSVTV